MAAKQSMIQVITQADMEVVIMVVKGAENPVNAPRSVHKSPRPDGPALKQPTFSWKAADKYPEL